MQSRSRCSPHTPRPGSPQPGGCSCQNLPLGRTHAGERGCLMDGLGPCTQQKAGQGRMLWSPGEDSWGGGTAEWRRPLPGPHGGGGPLRPLPVCPTPLLVGSTLRTRLSNSLLLPTHTHTGSKSQKVSPVCPQKIAMDPEGGEGWGGGRAQGPGRKLWAEGTTVHEPLMSLHLPLLQTRARDRNRENNFLASGPRQAAILPGAAGG